MIIKKYSNRIVTLVIAIIFSVTLHANTFCGNIQKTLKDEANGYIYEMLEDGTLEISGYFGKETSLVLPEQFQGYQITSIGKNAFAENTVIEKVVIPQYIKVIGVGAFYKAEKLETVEIYGEKEWLLNEHEVEYFQNNVAFAGCSNLTTVVLGGGIKDIGIEAFYMCENLKEIHIPPTVGNILPGALGYTVYSPGGEPSVTANHQFVIHGYKNSAAERYAQRESMVFVSVGDLLKEYMLDMNYDSSVDAADALLVLKHSAKISVLDYNQRKIADYNSDEEINSVDALGILRKVAGL